MTRRDGVSNRYLDRGPDERVVGDGGRWERKRPESRVEGDVGVLRDLESLRRNGG